MNAPMNRNPNGQESLSQETLKLAEVNPMTTTKMTGKLNRKVTRSNIGKLPAKILGGLAITALMAAAVVSPLSARPILAEEPASPLVKEVSISYDQLIDDLGEWGLVSAKSSSFAVNFADEDWYFTPDVARITSAVGDDADEDGYFMDSPAKIAPAVPSHDQLMDDLGEWGLVSGKASPLAVNFDDEDGYFTPTTSRITKTLPDDAEQDGYFTDNPAKTEVSGVVDSESVISSYDRLMDEFEDVELGPVAAKVTSATVAYRDEFEDVELGPVAAKVTSTAVDYREEFMDSEAGR